MSCFVGPLTTAPPVCHHDVLLLPAGLDHQLAFAVVGAAVGAANGTVVDVAVVGVFTDVVELRAVRWADAVSRRDRGGGSARGVGVRGGEGRGRRDRGRGGGGWRAHGVQVARHVGAASFCTCRKKKKNNSFMTPAEGVQDRKKLTAGPPLHHPEFVGLLGAGGPLQHALVLVGKPVRPADRLVVQRAVRALAEGQVLALHAHRVVGARPLGAGAAATAPAAGGVAGADVPDPHLSLRAAVEAGGAAHLALVVVGASVGGAHGPDQPLAALGAGAGADALLGRAAQLAVGARQKAALIQAWKKLFFPKMPNTFIHSPSQV